MYNNRPPQQENKWLKKPKINKWFWVLIIAFILIMILLILKNTGMIG